MIKLLVNSYRMWLYLGLLITPFVFWRESRVVHEIPKVWVVLVWIEILALLSVILVFARVKINKITNVAPMFLYLLVVIIGSVLGVDVTKSIFGNYYRLDGLVTLFHLVALALSLALFARKWDMVIILKGVLTGSGLISLWVLFEFLGKLLAGQGFVDALAHPIGISFGQPNFLGGYLAVTTPIYFFFLHRAKTKSIKIALLLLLLIQIVSITLTHSIGSVLTLAFGLFVYYVLQVNRKVRLVAVALFVTAVVFYVYKLLTYAPGPHIVYEGRQRIILKTVSGVILDKRYLTGFGIANVDYAFDSGVWPLPVYGDVYLDKAHSTLLESFVTTGILGLGAYLFLLGVVLKKLYMRSKHSKIYRTYFFIFALYLFHSQTNIISISEELLFWLVVGKSITEQ